MKGGDLYIIVDEQEHALFKRKGWDIHINVEVDQITLQLGGVIEFPTLEGTSKLKFPPNTNSGQTFRIKEKGIPYLKDSAKRGDFYIKVLNKQQAIKEKFTPTFKDKFGSLFNRPKNNKSGNLSIFSEDE